jgi:hypothetical protein
LKKGEHATLDDIIVLLEEMQIIRCIPLPGLW